MHQNSNKRSAKNSKNDTQKIETAASPTQKTNQKIHSFHSFRVTMAHAIHIGIHGRTVHHVNTSPQLRRHQGCHGRRRRRRGGSAARGFGGFLAVPAGQLLGMLSRSCRAKGDGNTTSDHDQGILTGQNPTNVTPQCHRKFPRKSRRPYY